jgi:hypothetical protein
VGTLCCGCHFRQRSFHRCRVTTPLTERQLYSCIRMATLKRPGVVRRLRATLSILMSIITVTVVLTIAADQIARAHARLCRKRTSRRKFRASSFKLLGATLHSTDFEFKACFRMNREFFRLLLSKLEPLMQCDVGMVRRSSGDAISPSTRLAMAIRMLAGASYVEVFFAFKVSQAAAYSNTHYVVGSIL